MVKNMVTKDILTTKLSKLNSAFANFRNKFKTVWFVLKQVWYVPFIWSLAWYSYWIFRNTIVLKTPLMQVNPTDYLGVAISIVALIVAGHRSRAPTSKSVATAAKASIKVKNALTSHKDNNIPKIQPHSFNREYAKSTQANQPKQLTQESKYQPQIKTTCTLEIDKAHENKQSPSRTKTLPIKVADSKLNQVEQGLSAECLTCKKLVRCTNRQKRAVELSSQIPNHTACPYSTEL